MTALDTTMTVPFQEEQAQAFAGWMLETMNRGSLALMISIGHRTGLFDTLRDMDWATSADIAAAAGLQERYVREWLGAMVTGRIVLYQPDSRTYKLPAEHAAYLTRAAGTDNIAQSMQWMSVLGSVEDQVVEKFRTGGGVHYCEYHRFHPVMAEESALTVVAGLRQHILPLVPGLVDRLQAGMDVLEIGCGSGRASCMLAELFPRSRFSAYDLCADAIESAEALRRERGLTNLRFETRDITHLQQPAAHDLVLAFDVIHDQKDPASVLAEVRRTLRKDGVFLMQDIAASSELHKNMDHHFGPYFYTISTMHCMTVSLAQGGAGLGTVWGEELALKMLAQAGFRNVEVKKLPHDIINNYYLAR